MAASMASGAMLKLAGSMSTKTGVPPVLWIVPAVAKNVNGVRDDLVAGLQIQGAERQEKRIGAAGAANRVPGVREPGDFGLELRDLGPHDEPLALDDGHHGRGGPRP